MGTNYYLSEQSPCPTCNRGYERKHIGKSSAGWCFSLHVFPENGIGDLPDWQAVWSKPGAVITDEYGETIAIEDMLLVIMTRARKQSWGSPPTGYQSWSHFHTLNDSEESPTGLLRHKLSQRCVSHGAGTWDCVVGEFS